LQALIGALKGVGTVRFGKTEQGLVLYHFHVPLAKFGGGGALTLGPESEDVAMRFRSRFLIAEAASASTRTLHSMASR
jgi:hypothetical protein